MCKLAQAQKLVRHAVIEGHTTIGENNRIFQFASLGAQPQDKKYRDEPTKLIIGNGNTIQNLPLSTQAR